jgi:hypothetical protein
VKHLFFLISGFPQNLRRTIFARLQDYNFPAPPISNLAARMYLIFFIASILFNVNIINLFVLMRKLVPNWAVYVTIRI